MRELSFQQKNEAVAESFSVRTAEEIKKNEKKSGTVANVSQISDNISKDSKANLSERNPIEIDQVIQKKTQRSCQSYCRSNCKQTSKGNKKKLKISKKL